jgi:transporter family-2 protein
MVGTLGPIQTGVNATLSNYLTHPSQAAFISFLGGVIIYSIILFFLKPTLPSLDELKKIPLWAFTGGLMGACIVFGAIIIAPKIGAATYVSTFITGTIIMSLLLDHFGLMAFQTKPIDLWTIFGASLVITGMMIVNFR